MTPEQERELAHIEDDLRTAEVALRSIRLAVEDLKRLLGDG